MPYTMEKIPDAIKRLPKHAKEIWIAAFNSAFEQYKGDEEKCHATAWAAVKTKYEKNEQGEWVEKKSEHAEWIPVFRTGTHTDSAGNTRAWTENDLDRIASTYDPSRHEAPVVIGHPQDNAPAWGWVEALRREGEILYAKPKQLIAEFVDMLKKGMFKKRSIALYPDGSLRHIGFLGAMPPAVKGLPDVAFKEKGELTIEFAAVDAENQEVMNKRHQRLDEKKFNGYDRKGGTNMSFWERLKKRLAEAGVSFKELFGSDSPPVLYTEDDIKTKTDAAVSEALKAKEKEFAEAQEKKEKAFAEREKKLKTQEAEARKKAITEFCETLKGKGILTPAMEKIGMGITEFMQQISSIETAVEFGEEGKKEKQTPLAFIQEFLSHLPKAVEFKEIAGNEKDVKGGNAAEKLEALVKEKMKADKALTYGAAFAEVQKENPDLAAEYADEMKGGK